MSLERMGAYLIHLTLVNHLMNCLHKSGINCYLIIHLTLVNHLVKCLRKSIISYNLITHLTLVNHLVNSLHKFGIIYNLGNDPVEANKRNGIKSISIIIKCYIHIAM